MAAYPEDMALLVAGIGGKSPAMRIANFSKFWTVRELQRRIADELDRSAEWEDIKLEVDGHPLKKWWRTLASYDVVVRDIVHYHFANDEITPPPGDEEDDDIMQLYAPKGRTEAIQAIRTSIPPLYTLPNMTFQSSVPTMTSQHRGSEAGDDNKGKESSQENKENEDSEDSGSEGISSEASEASEASAGEGSEASGLVPANALATVSANIVANRRIVRKLFLKNMETGKIFVLKNVPLDMPAKRLLTRPQVTGVAKGAVLFYENLKMKRGKCLDVDGMMSASLLTLYFNFTDVALAQQDVQDGATIEFIEP